MRPLIQVLLHGQCLLEDKENIRNHMFLRGTFGARGDRVPRRFPVALSPSGEERRNYTKGSGRLETG